MKLKNQKTVLTAADLRAMISAKNGSGNLCEVIANGSGQEDGSGETIKVDTAIENDRQGRPTSKQYRTIRRPYLMRHAA